MQRCQTRISCRLRSDAAARMSTLGGLLVASIMSGTPARAQILQGPLLASDLPLEYNRGRNVSVLERERPEFEADGVRVGGFIVFPRIEIATGYSDNVFGLSDDEVGDAFVAVDPTVAIESDWNVHSITASAGARVRRFADQTSRNETGLFGRINGRLEVTRDAAIETGGFVERAYEQRFSGTFPANAFGNVKYLTGGSYLRGTYQAGRVRGLVSVDVSRLDFNDVRAFGGSIIDQDDRDRSAVRFGGRGEYAFTTDASAFVQGTYSVINYDGLLANGRANRDSKEFRAIAGLTFDLTALIRGRFGVGYVRRDFKDRFYDDVSGIAAEARIEYFLTELTTVTIGARRFIEDANLVGSGGYFGNGVSARVDHELLRNLLLNVGVDYERDVFKGVTRKDDVFFATGGARYLVNRSVGVGFNLAFVDRSSSGDYAGSDFVERRATVSLILQR